MTLKFILLPFRVPFKACKKPCHERRYKGDKTCDDGNNHCGCGWDGGDCCGTTKDYDYNYCTKCKCLDPKNQPKLKPGQKCDLHKRGDSYCDPGNNHENCDFDGGDCCGTTDQGRLAQYHLCTGKQILKNGACTCKVGTSCFLFRVVLFLIYFILLSCCSTGSKIQSEKELLTQLFLKEMGW